jgi:DinB superfamily
VATRVLTRDEIMDILRPTVPRLEELTHGVPQKRLYTVTDYGWSVNDQLAHLRACHDVLGGNMLRIVREDHPAWKGMSPRAWQKQTDYFEWKFRPAFEAFRVQRAELLEVVEPLPPEAWERTATVTVPPRSLYEYSMLYYGDWMARHERGHVKHIARILKEV